LVIASVANCPGFIKRSERFKELASFPHLKGKASVVVGNGHWFAITLVCHGVPFSKALNFRSESLRAE
jgi:hypothetical protein